MRFAKLSALCLFSLAACGSSIPPGIPHGRPALTAILREAKFVQHDEYVGADTPEDQAPLRAAVDSAIHDVDAMADPLDAGAVRNRLEKLLRDTDTYATADRDEVARYAVRIWRAAGFKEDSGLFPVGDDRALVIP